MGKYAQVIIKIKVLEKYSGIESKHLLVPSLYEWVNVYWEKMTKQSDGSWHFNYVLWHSDIMHQLCELANGISTDFQTALLYVNHDVDLIRRIAIAILKHGKAGVNITYGTVYDPAKEYADRVLGNPL